MKIEMSKENEIVMNALRDYVENRGDESEKDKHEKKRLDPNRFGVKDLTGLCLRATYYKKTLPSVDGEEFAFSDNAIVRISRGSLYDKVVSDFLGDKSQVKFEKETGSGTVIVGVLDGEFDDTVFELKTITDKGVYYVKQRMQPNMWDRLQAMVYAYARGKKKVELVYITPTEVVSFNMEFTPMELKEVWDDVVGKAFQLSQEIKTKSPPKKLKKSSWQCKGCRFKELCWGDKDE